MLQKVRHIAYHTLWSFAHLPPRANEASGEIQPKIICNASLVTMPLARVTGNMTPKLAQACLKLRQLVRIAASAAILLPMRHLFCRMGTVMRLLQGMCYFLVDLVLYLLS